MMMPERMEFERAESQARRHLGTNAWQREWDRGRGLRPADIDAELDRLLSGVEIPDDRLPPRPETLINLTMRELEVLRLLADGLTNPQIASLLSISRKTVANHVASILVKMDVTSRTAAVSFAIRHGFA